jgi:hypothetical protein
MLLNLALWTIMIINFIILLIPIMILNILFIQIEIIFTPGKEWLEFSAILVVIFLIYLINLEADRITNKIKNKKIEKNIITNK